MYSYYDLLGRIKEEVYIPEKISVSLTPGTSRIYEADYDMDNFTCYQLAFGQEADENYHTYLAECFLESNMFEDCIENYYQDTLPEQLNLDTDPDRSRSEVVRSIDYLLEGKVNEILKYLRTKQY